MDTLIPRPLLRRILPRSAWPWLVAAALFSAPAFAQSEDEAEDPSARVGRVSALVGAVEISRAPDAEWTPAQLNQVVTGRTAFWAPPGSQAELRIGSASVRLDGNTQAAFDRLDDEAITLDLANGTLRARVRQLDADQHFVLLADGVQAEATMPGDYRAHYDADRRTLQLRVLSGRLRVATLRTSFHVEAGEETLIEDDGERLAMIDPGAPDAFDAWAETRDRAQDQLASARYVSPETTGIEALDEHGHWQQNADYGPIWIPRAVPSGWAPYRYGHWTWLHPWGWTWVDDAPWGFAPFHYGRWAMVGPHWAWVPGPIVPRPVWAPALVGFVGGGYGGLNLRVGIGAPIGWFPLAPYELYHPSYRYSPRYVRHVHVINAGRPDGRPRGARREHADPLPRHRYAQHHDAVTMVDAESFRQSRPVARERIRLSPGQAEQLRPILAGRPDRAVRPDRPDRRDRVELPPAPPPRATGPRTAGRGEVISPRPGDAPGARRPPLVPGAMPDGTPRGDRGDRSDRIDRSNRTDRTDRGFDGPPPRRDNDTAGPRTPGEGRPFERGPRPMPREAAPPTRVAAPPMPPVAPMQPVPPLYAPGARPPPPPQAVPPRAADQPPPALSPVPPLHNATPNPPPADRIERRPPPRAEPPRPRAERPFERPTERQIDRQFDRPINRPLERQMERDPRRESPAPMRPAPRMAAPPVPQAAPAPAIAPPAPALRPPQAPRAERRPDAAPRSERPHRDEARGAHPQRGERTR